MPVIMSERYRIFINVEKPRDEKLLNPNLGVSVSCHVFSADTWGSF